MKDYSNYIPEQEPNRKKAWELYRKRNWRVHVEGSNAMVKGGDNIHQTPRLSKHRGMSVQGVRIK